MVFRAFVVPIRLRYKIHTTYGMYVQTGVGKTALMLLPLLTIYNALAVPLFFMEAKFSPLEKRIQNDFHQTRRNFSQEQPGAYFFTTRGLKKFWES